MRSGSVRHAIARLVTWALAAALLTAPLSAQTRGSIGAAFQVLLYSAASIKCGEKTLAVSYPFFPTDAPLVRIAVINGGKVAPFGPALASAFDRPTLEAGLRAICEELLWRGSDRGVTVDPEIHTLGQFPLGVESIYANPDNAPDLVAVNQNSHNVSLLLGIPGGSGTGSDPWYGNATHFPTGTRPQVVRSGDFDGDLKTDLLTANLGNASNGNLTLLYGNGDGTFDPPVALAAGTTTPTDAAVGLLDADNHLDIVVPDPLAQRVLVLFGNGNGTFDPPAARATPGSPRQVRIADWDDNGTLDLVTNEAILLGSGDGAPDLLAGLGGDRVIVWSGHGNGTFAPPEIIDAAGGGTLLVGLVDADRRLDVLSAVQAGEGGVTVLLNRTGLVFVNGFETGDTSAW